MRLHDLPFREIWALDFEFISESGAQPVPVCLVAREFRSNRLVRLFQDDLGSVPPFQTGKDSLFVAFFASAEWGCFASLGWPMPERILDLYAEFRASTNGLPLVAGKGLLGALAHHRISSITKEQKDAGRELVMRGGPWSRPERREILDYCQTDVDCLASLLEAMLPGMSRHELGLGRALLRGRYSVAVARMEQVGVPIDVPLLSRFRSGWEDIKRDLIRDIDRDFGVYDGTSFRVGAFDAYLAREGISWPRTATGQPCLDQDTFRDMTPTYPQLSPLKELRHALGEMRLEDLAIGPDGRNRTLLSPFSAKTSRNQPSNTKFIFGPSAWLRGLIKPEEGRALAYIDWSAQEIAIAAALSGDLALSEAVMSGDPYLDFAVRAGLAPTGATKASHGHVRDMCKSSLLGTNYGMGAETLALRCQIPLLEAKELLRRLARAYPTFTQWAQNNVDVAQLTGRMETVFGWPLHVTTNSRPNSLRNFPMQANGAEMLRVASCLATEAGVKVCAPVHDALLVEGDAGQIHDVVATTRNAMTEAARVLLGGLAVAMSDTLITYPERYADPRGAVMWRRVNQLLGSEVS